MLTGLRLFITPNSKNKFRNCVTKINTLGNGLKCEKGLISRKAT